MATTSEKVAWFLLLLLAVVVLRDLHRIWKERSQAEIVEGEGDVRLNLRPIIGILSQPSTGTPDATYIAASYVKFVESAGARVVPIQCNLPEEEMIRRFKAVNGIIIPGGGANLSPHHIFYDAANFLTRLAMNATDAGDYFPVHGTCLGYEALSIMIAENTTVLERFNGEDFPAPLQLTEAARHSRFFRATPPHVLRDLERKPYAMENHQSGLSLQSFDENPKLKRFFKVLSISPDRDGKLYISTIEARKYPITATQWHPEKNAFEWAEALHIPHSAGAVEVTKAVATFFVQEARKNHHRPASVDEEDELLIYNYSPTFTGKDAHVTGPGEDETPFDESYFFPMASTQSSDRGQE